MKNKKLSSHGVTQRMTSYYRHDYYVFEYCSSNNKQECVGISEGAVLPYKYQYNSHCLLPLKEGIRQETIPDIKSLLFNIQKLYYYQLRSDTNYRVLHIIEDAEQSMATFNKYLSDCIILWINSCLLPGNTTDHTIGEYLNHFKLFIEDVQERLSTLAEDLKKTGMNGRSMRGIFSNMPLSKNLRSFHLLLGKLSSCIIKAENDLKNPVNILMLN